MKGWVNDMKSGNRLLCIKQLADDIKEHGIDFVKGETYTVTAVGNGGSYIGAEDGSDVYFESKEDLEIHFKLI